ncbi:MAG: YhbY family RNA-binding protein [Candidatus Pacearchaeota archaeon]|nr:MAG: YhbY family RNA-binding protein [Candidatus Pacearchaeota archaeon]
MIISFQIGKQGLTKNFLDNLEKTFKKHDLIKVSVLKTATRDKKELKKIAQEICSELKKRKNKDFTAKIVGFTMFIKKWRKLRK